MSSVSKEMYQFCFKYSNVLGALCSSRLYSNIGPCKKLLTAQSLTKFDKFSRRKLCVVEVLKKHFLNNRTYKGIIDTGNKEIRGLPNPRTWRSWEADGVKWVIQDLLPEDDEEAIQMMLREFCEHEVLSSYSNMLGDPESVRGVTDIWRKYLAKRTSLACYAEINGQRRLAAVHIIMPLRKGEDPHGEIYGENFKNAYNAMTYAESKVDRFKYLGTDEVLTGLGLAVAENIRGARLGVKMLEARDQVSRYYGIKGSVGIFTSVISQKTAARVGYEAIACVSMKELADHGLNYPRDETKVIKVMAKKYE